MRDRDDIVRGFSDALHEVRIAHLCLPEHHDVGKFHPQPTLETTRAEVS
jgi:hypothetical protein